MFGPFFRNPNDDSTAPPAAQTLGDDEWRDLEASLFREIRAEQSAKAARQYDKRHQS